MEILSLGSKVKIKRKEKNMKLKDLAGDRITPGQISLIETGKSNPSDDLLKYLADKLDTTVEYFLESETKQAEDVCRFYSDIVESSLQCENYLRAEENIEKGLHYAIEYKVESYQGIFNYQKSNLSLLREDYNNAQKYALSALVIFLKVSHDPDIIKTFILLGELAIKVKEYNLAYNYYKEAETSYNKSDSSDKLLRIKIYYKIARCLSKLSEHSKAIDYALMVEKEVKELEDYKIYADTLMILAIAFWERGEKEKALEYAEKAKSICSQNRDLIFIANVEEDVGEFLINSLNVEDGLEHLKRALEIKNSIKGEKTEETIIKMTSGLIECRKYTEALDLIDHLEEKYDLNSQTKIKVFEYKYRIYKEINETSKSEEQILNLIKFLELVDEKEKLVHYYMLIASFYNEIEEDKLALKFFQKAFEVKKNQYSI
ncbi:helix-turn-helix domain-containing protein [Clostridium cylindrosporum]|uniref:Tetratricopeptide repeat/DNA binding domain protein n=1 Tax=Clostridium cylindrosporum DSM 605 TaxID=1121307 RepID=A0A0J8D9H5_CLOCY|nr:helix-turn-helix transcriptional regulator [Clostridium cylindrosporum]KMT22690.1 tetratricopeptide repeat/DNA binding domain protein [Clostridium cylindrosporum DSM 605]